ncbi:hypothetical protein CSC2_49970 [Clostridium zeae]|uniref:Major facilitator superfamily (MFS) profile domain-containing protein n=1 Tax=Clostridium zeae TaxID=2759022 RepID=A0ABQ1EI22_9CLOT|nr:MFS transporter [Clostridium zeae]GFZ34471.1 hypothetical protein CSC2_49970 [Clostridium zeae]
MVLNNKRNFFIIDFFVAFLVVFGVVMFLPMFQSLQSIFGVSVSSIAWLPNIGYLSMILFPAVAGKVMSKIGAKKSLLLFIVVWIIGISVEIIALNTVSYFIFCSGRLIEALAEAAFFPILLSMNKIVMKEERDGKLGSSLVEIGSAIGGLIAAVVAGYFLNSPKTFLLIPIVIGALTWIFVFSSINEISIEEDNESNNKLLKVKENKFDYISLLFMIFMTQITFAASQVYLSYYMESFNASNSTGLVISIEQILIATGAMSPMLLLRYFSFRSIRNTLIGVFVVCPIILALHISLPLSILALSAICLIVGIGFSTLNIYLSKTVVTNASQKISFYTAVRFAGGFALSFIWGNYIDKYKALGYNYIKIFNNLYMMMAVLVVIISVIVIIMQNSNKKLWSEKN